MSDKDITTQENSLSPKSILLKRIAQAAGLLLIIFFFVWAIPTGRAEYYQNRGGKVLNQIIEELDKNQGVTTYCYPESITNDQRVALADARQLLEKSLAIKPNNAHAYLLLGRTLCALGDINQAVEAYEQYTQMRPKNPLGHLELGFALEASCWQDGTNEPIFSDDYFGNTLCPDTELLNRIKAEWKNSEVLAGNFLDEGNQAFSKQQYESAFRWYQRASSLGSPIDYSSIFRWSVSAVLTNRDLPDLENNPIIVNLVSGNTQIEGENFQWMKQDFNWDLSYGDSLGEHSPNNPNVGIMWWDGVAVTFIDVPQKGAYQILVRTQDSPPGPIKLQIERDAFPIDEFILTEGDQAWHELEAVTIIPDGIHLIGIRFLENTGDAVIDWVQIKKYD